MSVPTTQTIYVDLYQEKKTIVSLDFYTQKLSYPLTCPTPKSAPPKIEKLRGTEVHTTKDHPTDRSFFFSKQARAQQHRDWGRGLIELQW